MTAWIYHGETTHRRQGAVRHRFRYRLFQLLLDIDRVDEDLKGLWMLRHGRFGLFSFADRDHGHRDGAPLRGWVEERLAQAGVTATARRIRLLAMPRVLGFVFNPISLFYVDDGEGRLEAVIYEVNSTFGQTHAYVAPASGAGPQRHTAGKKLFVSPFYAVDGAYRFDVSPPDERLTLTIVKSVGDQPDFLATLSARRETVTNRSLFRLFFGFPLMTARVVAAIHWQAVRLLVKGVPLVARAPAPNIGMSAAVQDTRPAGKNDVSLLLTEGSADDADRSERRFAGPGMGHSGLA